MQIDRILRKGSLQGKQKHKSSKRIRKIKNAFLEINKTTNDQNRRIKSKNAFLGVNKHINYHTG